MEPTLTLYDLASAAGNVPFSPNTWPVRLALNYKRLPFKTVWLHLVDIKPVLKNIGAPPTYYPLEPDGVYTVPILVDTSNPDSPNMISDSFTIMEYLDEKYSERPIFPGGTKSLVALFKEYFWKNVIPQLFPLLVPTTLQFIAECDRGYYRQTRERWLGIKLEDMCSTVEEREEQWERLKKAFEALAILLEKNGQNQELVMGNQVSVGDFIIVGIFAWMNELEPDGWEKARSWNHGRWERLWDRSEDWRVNKI